MQHLIDYQRIEDVRINNLIINVIVMKIRRLNDK